MALVKICKVGDVPEGGCFRAEVDGLPPLAVFNVDNSYFIMNDTCSHGEASLSEGEIEDGQVECPWHNAKFCIKSGAALTFPAVEAQKIYQIKLVDNDILIEG
jgi:nitrite reductase/ring-hydroxylating ferredoxin subunit